MSHARHESHHRTPRIGIRAWVIFCVGIFALTQGGVVTAALLFASGSAFSPRVRQRLGVPKLLGFPLGVGCFALALRAAEMAI